MSDPRPIPYGSWPSPLAAATVASSALRLGDLQMDGGDLYWVEGRPSEQGRCVVMRHREGAAHDLLPAPFSARTTVHEYGGGALLVDDGVVYFVNMTDQRLHVIAPGERPRPLTGEEGDVRYADMVLDRPRGRLISVVEDHRGGQVVNDIRAVDLQSGTTATLVSGNDFYAAPRLSPDGSQLAWLTWNQPNMPWDGTELWIARIDAGGRPADQRRVAGGAAESVFQPAWSPQGELHFCSDRSGWWNLYRVDGSSATALAPMEADCGRPAWVFGLSTYAFCGEGRIALLACDAGVWHMHILNRITGSLTEVRLPYTDFARVAAGGGDTVAAIAAGPHQEASVIHVDTRSGASEVVRASNDVAIDSSILSTAEAISFPGHNGATTYAFLYPPRNDAVRAVPEERPPLRVYAHGGPTGAVGSALDLQTQFWTSRGWAVLAVNYGGSTGYGREYRRRLNGQEGVVDVEDCIAGARHLATEGLVDGQRMVISGGSAGGYIVLCAMTFHDVFAAGADHYGIADWETMLNDTHKFEARYFDSMIGPYPERRDLFYERSPIHFIDRVRRPVIILQGDEDAIVPPSQSQVMYDALRERGIPSAYLVFKGEQHGFRRAGNIARALEAELYFFSRILGIEPADAIDPVEIAKLEVKAR